MANNQQPQVSKSARIGIIGGGPAGVSAAYFLRKEGYTNITLLESAPHIAGKSASFQVNGNAYDQGALMVGSNYHNVRELAAELDCPLEKFVGRALDMDTNRIIMDDTDKICIYNNLLPHISDYLEKRTSFEDVSRPGHGDLSEQKLYAPVAQWLKDSQMEYMKEAWGLAFTSAGYGYMTDDTPAAYFHKFVENSENTIFYFPQGFFHLWERMVKDVNVVCDAHVTSIDRSLRDSDRGITFVTYENRQTHFKQTLVFDEIIVATNPKQTKEFLDVTPAERELLDEVFFYDYYTIIATVDGLSTTAGLTTIPKHCSSKDYVGHATAFYCAHEGVPTYTFYAYGNETMTQERVAECFKQDVAKMGGTLKEIHLFRRWDFFPHVNSLSMARGFYNKAEQLQGRNGTWHVGGWLDLELTENCVSYSRDLVRRFSGKSEESLHVPVTPPVQVKAPAELNWGTVLRISAKRFPDRAAFTWVDSNLKEETVYTYADLYRQARAVAHYLTNTAQHKAGDRVMLCYAPGLKFLPVLFGCLMCGVIAVPVAPPNLANAEKDIARFTYLTKTTGAKVVFSDKNYVKYTMLYAAKSFVGLASKIVWPTGLDWVDTDAVTSGKQLYEEHLIDTLDSDSVAVLQFSSGSTADPKGVMLSHKNTLHNVDLMQSETGIHADSTFAFWVPQFHDLGLIGGFLNTVRAGCRAIVMSPLAFLQKPEAWLQMISRYGANFTAAPNFAYEHVRRRCSDNVIAELDLSSLKGAFNGAEPVRWSTLRGFSKRFESTGFKIEKFKCLYGLAEHCAYAVGFKNATNAAPTVLDIDPDALRMGVVKTRNAESSAPNNIVSTGAPSLDMQIEIRIVDPETKRLCSPNTVGEVWLNSPSVGKGYFGLEAVSDETFRAKIQHENHGDWRLNYGSFLRTGDLGFMHNGELFITGRQKDVIIINGKNHYPQDIELTVEGCHSLIRPGCIAAINHSDHATATDALIILAEIRNTKTLSEEDAYEVGDAIAQAVPANHGVPCARIVLLKHHSLPKTTSGKLQRSRAKDMLTNGTFDKKTLKNIGDVARETSRVRSRPTSRSFQAPPRKVLEVEEIERVIATSVRRVSKVAARLPADALDVNANLVASLGLDSLAAVQLTSMLQKELNIDIAPAILMDVPTISGLARHIVKLIPEDQDRTTATTTTTVSAQAVSIVSLTEIETVIGNHVHKISKLAAKRPRDQLDVKANLVSEYGFDSLAAVQLTSAVSQSFGVEIAAGLLYDIHTVADLAAHIYKMKNELTTQSRTGGAPSQNVEPLSDDEKPSIFALSPPNNRNQHNAALFCIHPLLGNVASYVHLAQIVGMTRPVYGIASPKVFPSNIQALARRYVQSLRESHPTGPYHLCGYSYGGLIAWEMARELVATGEVVGGLYLIDAPAPLAETVREPLKTGEKPEDVWSDDIDRLMNDVDSQWMVRKEQMEPSELQTLRSMVGGHIAAMYEYTMDISALTAAQPFVVHFWRAKDYAKKTSRLLLDHPEFSQQSFGWERYNGTFVAHTPIPGHHYNVLLRENCGRIAKEFDRAIPSERRRSSSVELKPLMLADSLPPVSPTCRRESNASTIVASPVHDKNFDKAGDNSHSLVNTPVPLYLSLIMTSMVTYTSLQIAGWWYQCM